MSARHRHHLKGKEIQEILEELKVALPNLALGNLKERQIEVSNLDSDDRLYFLDGKPAFLSIHEEIFPTLINNEALDSAATITVDAGAIPHVCNGSALMAPGIVKIDGTFEKNAVVILKEVTHGKAIAVVKTLLGSDELSTTEKGRVALNLHYVGDKYWKIYRNLA